MPLLELIECVLSLLYVIATYGYIAGKSYKKN